MMKDGATTGILKMQLGTDKECIVCNGECAALILAMELIRQSIGITQYLRRRQRNAGIKVMVHWIPGHEDIEGNEWADRAAKEAAQGRVSRRETLPAILQARDAIKRSKSALLQTYNMKLRKRARKDGGCWKGSRGWKLWGWGSPQVHTAMRLQACRGSKQASSHSWSLATPPQQASSPDWGSTFPNMFGMRGVRRDGHHYLVKCEVHRAAREGMRGRIGRAVMNTDTILGNVKHYPVVIQFVERTRRCIVPGRQM
ncbi:RNA-directed DNA polymerase from transposon X-element [Salix suchowensis]|nr:RNA-directed DNA polymerase from transposon X-element [Salix suchowensis]